MKTFVENVLEQYKKKYFNPETIVDDIFVFIQNDRTLMKEYLELVSREKNLKYVNSQISQEIEKSLNLSNEKEEEKNPKSLLIQSYTKLI